jgi:hypothetical protein
MTSENFKLSDRARNTFIGMIILGIVGVLLTLWLHPQNHHSRLWTNLLLNTYLFTGISLIGLFFVAAHQQGWGGWVTMIKRVPEAIASFIVVMAVFGLIIILGADLDIHNLYAHWMNHSDAIVAGKKPLLNKTTWTIINVAFYAGWVLLIYFYRKASTDEDKALTFGAHYVKMRTIAAIFLVFFGVSQSIFSWTMVMSIDPHWYSTLFGWYNFASYACAGVAFMIIIVIYLKSRGYMQMVNESHLHDLGKFMFGFSVFWTYLWFSQFMLQWYANIPEDTIFWVKRWNDGWYKFWFYAVLIINFAVPFLFLLGRGAKRRNGRMLVMAVIVIFGHYMDFYNLIMFEPNMVSEHHEEHGKKESAGHHSSIDNKSTVLYAEATHGTADSKVETTVTKTTEEAVTTMEATHNEASHTEANTSGEHGAKHAVNAEEHSTKGEKAHHEEAPKHYSGLGLPELFIFLGFVGMFLLTVFTTLSKYSLIPKNDAYLKESMNHHI